MNLTFSRDFLVEDLLGSKELECVEVQFGHSFSVLSESSLSNPSAKAVGPAEFISDVRSRESGWYSETTASLFLLFSRVVSMQSTTSLLSHEIFSWDRSCMDWSEEAMPFLTGDDECQALQLSAFSPLLVAPCQIYLFLLYRYSFRLETSNDHLHKNYNYQLLSVSTYHLLLLAIFLPSNE